MQSKDLKSRAHAPFSLTNQIEERDRFLPDVFFEDKTSGYEIMIMTLQILSAFHLCGKTGDNFPPDGTVRMEKTVVPLWNQMERFFPLVILGNKPRISTRSMVRECDRGKWFSNIPVISVKTGKEDYV